MNNIQLTTATINVKSNVPARISILYGIAQNKLNTATPFTKPTVDTSIKIGKLKLTPATTYYYQVVTKDADGNQNTSEIASFKTKGYSLTLTVLDSNYKPLINQPVTLHSDPITATTDDKGNVSFNNVAPGEHSLIYTAAGKTYSQQLLVENNVTNNNGVEVVKPQTAAIVLPNFTQTSQRTYNLATLISITAAATMFILLMIDISPIGPKVRSKLSYVFHTIGGQKHMVSTNNIKRPSFIQSTQKPHNP